jgi:hypothetical protein
LALRVTIPGAVTRISFHDAGLDTRDIGVVALARHHDAVHDGLTFIQKTLHDYRRLAQAKPASTGLTGSTIQPGITRDRSLLPA